MTPRRSAFVLGFLLSSVICAVCLALLQPTRDIQAAQKGPSRTVLKVAHALDTLHPVHISLEYMRAKLLAYSGATLDLEIHAGGVLGNEVENIEQLRLGVLAMTKTSAASLSTFVPQMELFGLPYLFQDHDHYWQFLASETGQDLLTLSQEKGLVGLAYLDAGSRNFYSRENPVASPEDLIGKKIRVMNSKMAMQMVKALGGSPTPIAWGELYTALAQGTVDGAENNPQSYVSNRHYEVSPFFSLDAHTRIPDVLLIGSKALDKLTSEQQSWLANAADDASRFQQVLWKVTENEALKEARSKGATIITVENAAFEQASRRVYDELTEPELISLVSKVESLKK